MTSYSLLSLGDIMMHQITRASKEASFELTLTEEPVELSPQNREFLTSRLVDALRSRDLPIVHDAAVESDSPSRILGIWGDPSSLIEQSRSMAEALKSKQPGQSLPGLLVVARGTLGPDDVIVVAKIEHQAAIRIQTQTNDAGHQVFRLERLKDLVFGDGARVYKVAVFSRAASSTGQLSGDVADVQNRGGFANYFLSSFLGMKLREEPAVLTEQFLTRMTSAINDSSLSSEDKLDVQSALVTHLASNANQISGHAFIRDHVPAGHQAELSGLAASQKVPLSQFPKDTAQVSSRLKRLRLDYSGDIVVIAPPEAVGDGKRVQVSQSDDEASDTITITGGHLGSVRGNGSR